MCGIFYVLLVLYIFFFKQKTAYEMRISDWSSDVCSSYLIDIPTIAVGNIFEVDHVNSIIAAGRADLCALARPHQMDPNWTIHAAAMQDYKDAPVPEQYKIGRAHV